MSQDHIDKENLTVTGAHRRSQPPGLRVKGDVIVIITQAFGPKGDNLVGISEVTFEGHPAVTIGVRADGREGLVHLSPIHGDRRKLGFTDIAEGTRCELYCPVSGETLMKMGEVDDGSGADYYGLFLTERLDEGAVVAISDIWGHYHSRIVDDNELISYWAATHADA